MVILFCLDAVALLEPVPSALQHIENVSFLILHCSTIIGE